MAVTFPSKAAEAATDVYLAQLISIPDCRPIVGPEIGKWRALQDSNLRGIRLRDYTPLSHWHTHTIIAGLRVEGVCAPAVFDGPIDNPTFLAYVEQVLVPALRPGDVVVFDNLAVHKQPARARGDRSGRRAPPLSAALQSRLQSD